MKREMLLAWFLLLSSGGSGFFSQMQSAAPLSIFGSQKECVAARDKRLADYAAWFDPEEPIRRGPGWIEGRLVYGIEKTTSVQFYLLECVKR